MNLQKKVFSAALILFFLLAQTFWAQSNWTVEQITNGGDSDIEVESNGDVHMVYELRTRSRVGKNIVYEDDVYYIKKTTAGWSTPLSLSLPGFDEGSPSVDVDDAGVAHVVFTRHTKYTTNTLDGILYYWNSLTENFVAIDDFPIDIDFPGGADIVVGSDGIIHVALTATHICCVGSGDQSNIYYTKSDGSSFDPIINIESGSSTPIDGRYSARPSIELDENGNVGILFTTVIPHKLMEEEIYSISYTNNSMGSFFSPVKVFEGGIGEVQLQEYPPFKLSSEIAYIVFNKVNDLYNWPGRNDLLFAKFDAETGDIIGNPTVVAQEIGYSYNGTSIDYKAGALHVAYVGYYNAGTEKKEDWRQEVRYIQLDANTGDQISSLESINDGGDPNIVVSTDGVANISFTNGGNVFYATNTELPPSPGEKMHVSGITMDSEVKGARWNAVAKIYIKDLEVNAVDGAIVTGSWSGLVSGTNSATADADGIVTVKSEKTKSNGEITFTVTDVAKADWVYDRRTNFADPASGSISSPLGKRIAENEESSIPDSYALFDNYPNPFNPTTKIKYSIPEEAYVILKVYDILGKEITSLVNQSQQPGYYEIDFNASNLSNNVYFYILQAGDFVETKKMLLLK